MPPERLAARARPIAVSLDPDALRVLSNAALSQPGQRSAFEFVPSQDLIARRMVVASFQFAHQRGLTKRARADVKRERNICIPFVLVQRHIPDARPHGLLERVGLRIQPDQCAHRVCTVAQLDSLGITKAKRRPITWYRDIGRIAVALMHCQADQRRGR